jgi:hypothetical protein
MRIEQVWSSLPAGRPAGIGPDAEMVTIDYRMCGEAEPEPTAANHHPACRTTDRQA